MKYVSTIQTTALVVFAMMVSDGCSTKAIASVCGKAAHQPLRTINYHTKSGNNK